MSKTLIEVFEEAGDFPPHTPRKRTNNPNWPDTKEARAARQAKRMARLNELARAAGYETWRKLETAALSGDVISLNTLPADLS